MSWWLVFSERMTRSVDRDDRTIARPRYRFDGSTWACWL
jgi:hypothetical protein